MTVAPLDQPSGAADIARLLAESGSRLAPDELPALLKGVAAAPEGEDSESWMRLVAPKPSAQLRAALRLLRRRAAEEVESALAAMPVGERVARLRGELKRRGLAGFIVPRADEHQGEYVPLRAQRLAWISGFTGSAGLAIVLTDRAALFIDGRYTLQARAETDENLFERRHILDEPPSHWLAENLRAGDRLGYDPWLHTPDGVAVLAKAAERAGAKLEPCAESPLDAVWHGQPASPLAPVVPHPERFAGKSSAAKRVEIGEGVAKAAADAAVLTQPDAIAWLLNIRGGDVPHTPLPLSFALVNVDGSVQLFIDRRKLLDETVRHLGNGVTLSPPDQFGPALDRLGENGRRVLVDPTTAAAWVVDRLGQTGARIVRGDDPCMLPKACKNAVEIGGTKAAHRRDGAALTRFLAWVAGEAPKGELTELVAAARLRELRSENELFRDLSFETISGAGPNGAIVHYRSSAKTDRKLEPGTLYLVDLGAQYLDGTTDVTRTIAVGEPTAEMRDRFTRVLKGHIAIATARFPRGTSGAQIDALGRMPLWQAGLDYDHGTGHGVGSYLGVHEGPHRISKLPNRVALQPGMIVSNEPGYYKTGAYGIRIENLVTVVPVDPPSSAERDLLGFETLTLAPIDLAVVEPSMLDAGERAWLDDYHAKVRETLTPLVDEGTRTWLAHATRPLGMATPPRKKSKKG